MFCNMPDLNAQSDVFHIIIKANCISAGSGPDSVIKSVVKKASSVCQKTPSTYKFIPTSDISDLL